MVDLDRLRDALPSSTWFGIGLFGALGFAIGLWQPLFRHLPGTPYLEWALAAGGGALAYLGFTFGHDVREQELRDPKRRPLRGRAKELAIAPSLEVYRPPPVSPAHDTTPPSAEESAPNDG